jgi:hypothetical protein
VVVKARSTYGKNGLMSFCCQYVEVSNLKVQSISPEWLWNRDSKSGPDDDSHPVTRPSLFVNPAMVVDTSPALMVNFTGISFAGRPIVVSRTWQVIGGREDAIVVPS